MAWTPQLPILALYELSFKKSICWPLFLSFQAMYSQLRSKVYWSFFSFHCPHFPSHSLFLWSNTRSGPLHTVLVFFFSENLWHKLNTNLLALSMPMMKFRTYTTAYGPLTVEEIIKARRSFWSSFILNQAIEEFSNLSLKLVTKPLYMKYPSYTERKEHPYFQTQGSENNLSN
jgi:hypothetical protein